MSEFIIAKQNGRTIPHEDKIFGISNRAKAAIAEFGRDKVINGTIGALLDDEGKLIVLKSVDKVYRSLEPEEYAEYAPIGGIAPFKEAIKKAAFGKYEPAGYKEAVAAPGGTGALRNVVSNYSEPGDSILTSDWFWSPYGTITGEIGRKVDTFTLFTEDRQFNSASLQAKVEELLAKQNSLILLLNTPAHNPTGYSLTLEDWDKVIEILTAAAAGGKTITLLIDTAYIDFAGDEDEYREFMPKLEKLPENVLPVIAYSISKTFTLYGGRCGATICVAKTPEIAAEFKRVCEYAARGSWSNCSRAGQAILARVYEDPALLEEVCKEREFYRNMLLARGKAFSEEADKCGLEIVPYDAGFFISIPCEDPDAASKELEKENLFLVPLAKGLRVSLASVSEANCRIIPAMIKKVLDK